MIFKWLKKLFGLYDSSPTEIPANGELKPSASKSLYDELDKRKEHVKQNRDKLKQSPIDWYSLNTPSQKDELQTRVFSPRKFENIPSLQTLKGVSRFFVGIIFYLREVLLTSRYEKRLFEHASQPCVAGTDIRLLPHLRSRTNLSRDSYPFG